ncbi:MAG: hypothetical protein ACI3VK_00845 [Oscillospiraceae bacterium]
MEWYIYVLSAVGGAVFGLAAAYLNMRISRASLGTESLAGIMGVNMLRLLIDVIALTAIYFVCKALSLPLAVPLIAAALGLSVGGMLFLKQMTKKIQSQRDDAANGGE